MNKKIEKTFFLIILIFIIIFGQNIFFSKGPNKEVKVTIKQGDSVSDIGNKLKEKGLINNSLLFKIYIFGSGNRPNLQAGNYIFNASKPPYKIAQKIIKGETEKVILTIPEGWNLRDIAWYFENNGLFQAEEFFELAGLPAKDLSKTNYPKPQKFDHSFLDKKPENISLEGFIFPDTYELERNFQLKDFINKSLINFDQKLTSDLKKEIKRKQRNIFEIITMASLIEREVSKKEDKKIVSGILWKRLNNKVPLQVDATLLYITGKKSEILKKDKEINSLYNTYKYRGLPLGPICNPGLESIIAAIYPEESDFWYYLSTPKGETMFNKTLQEHNIDKLKYLK